VQTRTLRCRLPRSGTSGPSRSFFDLWAHVYDFAPVQAAVYRPVHDAVLRALRAGPHGAVLDVGCGTGQLVRRLTRLGGGTRVVGCDYSSGMLRQAAGRLRPSRGREGVAAPARGGAARSRAHARNVVLVQGDAGRLPFRDATFDAIVSTEAFHWFPDQPAALREFFRVLVPGGRLLLALVSPPALVSEVTYLASRLVGQPFYWPTMAGMRERLEAAGFRVERQRRVFRMPGFLVLPVLTLARRED